jgi:hypothetical protein
MDNNEIKVVIEGAKNSDEKSINQLLNKYEGMIKAYSFVNGEIKEELQQDLTEQIIKAIKKFKI